MTAGIDLVLAMIEQDLGVDVARAVARQLVVYHRRAGGQSQFSALLARPMGSSDGWRNWRLRSGRRLTGQSQSDELLGDAMPQLLMSASGCGCLQTDRSGLI
jgi:transcriptional regulator GlxA family with amidase domain